LFSSNPKRNELGWFGCAGVYKSSIDVALGKVISGIMDLETILRKIQKVWKPCAALGREAWRALGGPAPQAAARRRWEGEGPAAGRGCRWQGLAEAVAAAQGRRQQGPEPAAQGWSWRWWRRWRWRHEGGEDSGAKPRRRLRRPGDDDNAYGHAT